MIEENYEETLVRLAGTGIWTRDLSYTSSVYHHLASVCYYWLFCMAVDLSGSLWDRWRGLRVKEMSNNFIRYRAKNWSYFYDTNCIFIYLCINSDATWSSSNTIMLFTRLTSWESACKIIAQRGKISPLYPLPPSLALSHCFSRHWGINLKQRYSLFI